LQFPFVIGLIDRNVLFGCPGFAVNPDTESLVEGDDLVVFDDSHSVKVCGQTRAAISLVKEYKHPGARVGKRFGWVGERTPRTHRDGQLIPADLSLQDLFDAEPVLDKRVLAREALFRNDLSDHDGLSSAPPDGMTSWRVRSFLNLSRTADEADRRRLDRRRPAPARSTPSSTTGRCGAAAGRRSSGFASRSAGSRFSGRSGRRPCPAEARLEAG